GTEAAQGDRPARQAAPAAAPPAAARPPPPRQPQPLREAAAVGSVAVVVGDAPDPGPPERRVVRLGDDDRVLDRDPRLVVVAVQRPGLELLARERPGVHPLVEPVLVVAADHA